MRGCLNLAFGLLRVTQPPDAKHALLDNRRANTTGQTKLTECVRLQTRGEAERGSQDATPSFYQSGFKLHVGNADWDVPELTTLA